MSLELVGMFEDNKWYKDNQDVLHEMIKSLPSFICEKKAGEIWIKSENSKSTWEFDIRIFIAKDMLTIEVSSFNDAFYKEIEGLVENISSMTEFELRDDDGEVYKIS